MAEKSRKKSTKQKEADSPPIVIKGFKGFKGFDKNMQCRGFQYVEGKTYKHDGTAAACRSGFHFCENPLDVFGYYPPGESTFNEVEGSGQTDTHNEDSKVACTEIKIGASLSLPDFIGASLKFMFSRKYETSTSNHIVADSSASSATGDRSASSATGDSSASSATGDSSASSATGYSSASSATGYRSASSATGDSSASICTGTDSKAMAGKFGCIALAWWNEDEERGEMRCAETGCGDGSDGKLKAEVWYKLDDAGMFMEAGE
jgi:hypothetical protein